jgi:hypothetical protein
VRRTSFVSSALASLVIHAASASTHRPSQKHHSSSASKLPTTLNERVHQTAAEHVAVVVAEEATGCADTKG